jgi:DnaJ family protein A protein 2
MYSTGCHDSVKRECTSCEGQGVETVMYRMGPMVQQMQRKCSVCNGAGDMINAKNRCKTCQGKKLLQQTKTLDVHIAPGSQNGETIKFSSEGNQIVSFGQSYLSYLTFLF